MLQLFSVLADGRAGFMKALEEVDDRELMKSPQHRRYVAHTTCSLTAQVEGPRCGSQCLSQV